MKGIDLAESTRAVLEKLPDEWTLTPLGWKPSEEFRALERIAFADRQAPRGRWHIRRTPNGRAWLQLPNP